MVEIRRISGINGRSPYPFRVGIIFLFLLAVFFIHSTNCEAQMDNKSATFIGSARMDKDGVVFIKLYNDPSRGFRGSVFIYSPYHPEYHGILQHLGGLKKGEEKPVPPGIEKEMKWVDWSSPASMPEEPEVVIVGDKSSLRKEDAAFIDFTSSIKLLKPEDIYSYLFKPSKSSAHHYETTMGRIKLRVDDYVLEKIDYEIARGSPVADHRSAKTFWKTEDNLYFFMFTGGLAGGPQLFGPFQLKANEFLFIGKP